MNRLIAPSLAFLLAVLCSCGSKDRSATASLSHGADSVFLANPDFSGVALIADRGTAVYHKAFGHEDLFLHEPLDTNSVFELASVTKQFTAMAIMMLNEEGALSYDDDMTKFLPGLPYRGVTVRHLLHHTSGLPDYLPLMEAYWDKSQVAGNDEIIAYLAKYNPPALFQPGEKYEYSNTGYLLLASIVEKASGHDFSAFCKTRIFVPLQMTLTDMRTQAEKAMMSGVAWGYLYSDSAGRYLRADSLVESNYTVWLANRKGPGRMSSTSSDLLKWDQALYTETLVAKTTMAEAYAPAQLNDQSSSPYGFGWGLQQHPELGRIVRHGGDNPGYKTHIIRYIDVNKTIILLCNNAHRDFNAILTQLQKLVEGRKV